MNRLERACENLLLLDNDMWGEDFAALIELADAVEWLREVTGFRDCITAVMGETSPFSVNYAAGQESYTNMLAAEALVDAAMDRLLEEI